MKALDTNVLIRYLTQDDASQAKRATAYIENIAPAPNPLLSTVSCCANACGCWKALMAMRKKIVAVLEKILQTSQFITQDAETAWQALEAYKTHNVDFADALISKINKAAGFSKTATFDKKAAKLSEFELL